MGCLKLKYFENPSPLKVVYRANEAEQKPAQGFWSIDPLAGKNNHLSPYHAFNNNPILYVDPDGQDNVIYLIMLPDADGKLPKLDAKKIVRLTNKTFKNLGLNTRVHLYQNDPNTFNQKLLDDTDSWAAIGDYVSISEYAKNQGFNTTFASTNSMTGIPLDLSPGNSIQLNSDVVRTYTQGLRSPSDEHTVMFGILHGMTHNANVAHKDIIGELENNNTVPDYRRWRQTNPYGDVKLKNFGLGGTIMQVMFDENPSLKLTDFFGKKDNALVIEGLKDHYGTNKSKVNYYDESFKAAEGTTTIELREVEVKSN